MEALAVTDPEGWEAVLDRVDGFHDGVVVVAEYEDTTRVTEDMVMVFGDRATLRVLVLTQNPKASVIGLAFEDVADVRLRRQRDVEDEGLTGEGDAWRFEFLSLIVVASRCSVTVVGGDRGKELLGRRPADVLRQLTG